MAYTEDKRVDQLDQQSDYAANAELPVLPNGTTDLKRVQMDVIYPLINNLTEKTTDFNAASDELRLYDATEGEERKIDIDDFHNQYLVSDIYSVDLYKSSTYHGHLFLQKIGNLVVGHFTRQSGGAGSLSNSIMEDNGGSDIILPAEFAPKKNSSDQDGVQCVSGSLDASGNFRLNAIGLVFYTPNWKIQYEYQDTSGTFMSKNISICYVAADSSVYKP